MSLMRGRRFLVIARVGDNSLHKEWLQPAEFRNFDLCLSYYGSQPERYAEDCEYYLEEKGPKWPPVRNAVDFIGERIPDYDAIWFPDDDISADAVTINRMFHTFSDLQLSLAQPALAPDSFYLWPVTLQHEGFAVRYTQFVEIMVPLLSREALQIVLETFDRNLTGWGLDFVWPKLLGFPEKKIGIIDITPVKHTRPGGQGDLYQNINSMYKLNVWENNELRVLEEYEVDTSWIVDHNAITYYDSIPLRRMEPIQELEAPAPPPPQDIPSALDESPTLDFTPNMPTVIHAKPKRQKKGRSTLRKRRLRQGKRKKALRKTGKALRLKKRKPRAKTTPAKSRKKKQNRQIPAGKRSSKKSRKKATGKLKKNGLSGSPKKTRASKSAIVKKSPGRNSSRLIRKAA